MSPNIIVKKYEHFNTSFKDWDSPKGKWVRSKEHYEQLMRENGMVSFEEGNRQVEANKNRREREYKKGLTPKAMDLCKEIQGMGKADGTLKAGSNLIDAMKDVGVKFDARLPSCYQDKGGFGKE